MFNGTTNHTFLTNRNAGGKLCCFKSIDKVRSGRKEVVLYVVAALGLGPVCIPSFSFRSPCGNLNRNILVTTTAVDSLI